MTPMISVLIPAHNEAAYIRPCLEALFASDPLPGPVEVLVLANGCTDDTAEIARSVTLPQGWSRKVIDLPQGGKLAALNAGDARARGAVLVYLDADVTVTPPLLAQLAGVLTPEQPLYASGSPRVDPARSALTRAYGQFWSRLPFVTDGAPGFGLFAMTRTGRERWQAWPDIISDDTFARLSFAPAERFRVPARYDWPMVEGFANLVRVRRRQNVGVEEIAERFPHLLENDDKRSLGASGLMRLFLRAPLGFAAYALVSLTVKTPLFRTKTRWARGR
ncbi:Glycosyltransferase involved in cell wall biogenesis [Phaeobacter gallaeciensis]|uniref:Glycosyltransferase involved in cell wall biogenesis n=1 Tax=Phaeobacter gallaeciensis TaxID=60890 RepID=A0A1B0ZX85_9RHOB|nr:MULTISPECIES: glycosyltransferase family 2 protein [Phaeobacter]MEE2634729.1 glycosyltransferase family 2 protein [Pseudomonadota bacterium]ANP38690.1 Glycosyltransferase involved in cell wall biogenesis [Phaeobacter gallaeciensis]MDE4061737.1 glycosyltransferase family 2 protein [Phaeobacter gallaeciensis]MDE4124757.1 glycosyltransferase family 2 protein [Phaeobacter gallaeciensis]MDE4129316.1 glycosyltransferase family 2 protein [Phaeobacter gallaeciensis]